jgi:ribonuclease HII
MVALDDIKNLTPQERLDVFAKINSKDLELIMHHCSVELQERSVVEDNLLGKQTAEERRIWL